MGSKRKYVEPNQLMIDLRKEKNLTQRELADMISVSQAMIAEVEAGRKRFAEVKALFVAYTLEVTTMELFPMDD
ncbi:hypothetical protein JCM19046_3467 [Bacillus sp. JCM 19046]|nr:hypothetical protein JCM19045_4354 [Bacillus sp. JCM 19045]GAF18859.1 hypothetical protein JCM19046_3467 [Bacillus sp. JCM 19046]